ncbi:MAG: RNA polymerase sigma-70 factor [Odoribacteraceae bacterium]|nr:RNA polymerase sigma-70 factor [Odoribacteraceae bacterium]
MKGCTKTNILIENDISPEMLVLLRDGSHAAYEEIYLHYADSVHRFIEQLTRSGEAAREITQEIFVQLWERRAQVDPARSFKGYLFTIARNAAINFIEHQKVRGKYLEYSLHNNNESVGPSDEAMIASETALLVEIAVSRMPRQRKKIFLMNHEEGLNPGAIAERLHVSKHTVESHLATAKKEIKKMLE